MPAMSHVQEILLCNSIYSFGSTSRSHVASRTLQWCRTVLPKGWPSLTFGIRACLRSTILQPVELVVGTIQPKRGFRSDHEAAIGVMYAVQFWRRLSVHSDSHIVVWPVVAVEGWIPHYARRRSMKGRYMAGYIFSRGSYPIRWQVSCSKLACGSLLTWTERSAHFLFSAVLPRARV